MDARSYVGASSITRRELFEVWHAETQQNEKVFVVYRHIMAKLQLVATEEHVGEKVLEKSSNICKVFLKRWKQCHANVNYFSKKFSSWLNEVIDFNITEGSEGVDVTEPSTSSGRPRSSFEESSIQTRKRRVQPLLAHGSAQLALATQMSLYAEGKRETAAMLQRIIESPDEVEAIKKSRMIQLPIKLSPEEALAHFVQCRLSKQQYLDTRELNKNHNADIYPSYHAILEAKRACYPTNIMLTDYMASIHVQDIVDLTMKRLLEVQKCVISHLLSANNLHVVHLTAIYKWGCDGAAGQSQYKQRFTSEAYSDERYDDSYLFEISLVPIRIICDSCDNAVVWDNPRPSSTRFCRPLKILFSKESRQLVLHEVEHVKGQIRELVPTEVNIEGKQIIVKHDLHLTMIDGKICSYLSDTGSATCFICGATPSQMNSLDNISFRIDDQQTLKFGMSSLHAWIKIMECILHISYRLEVKSWKIKKDDLERVNVRKKQIQQKLRAEMGLLVDVPKPGFGTTNDGNTARKFFSNPHLSSQITGVDEVLIKRLGILLRTISCGFGINLEKFKMYAQDTAKLYIEKYNWYYMPITLHKVLIHGSEIIKSSIVPIGRMSEEAQESRHKDAKRFREHSTRKMSRVNTMEDLIHMLLVTSDPLINSFRKLPTKPKGTLSEEIISLLDICVDMCESTHDDSD